MKDFIVNRIKWKSSLKQKGEGEIKNTVSLLLIILLLISGCSAERVESETMKIKKHLQVEEHIEEMIRTLEYQNCYISELGDYRKYNSKIVEIKQEEIDHVIKSELDGRPTINVLEDSVVEDGDLVMISYEIVDQGETVVKAEKETVKVGKVNFDTLIEQSVKNRKVGELYSIQYSNTKMGLHDAVCYIKPLYIYTLIPAELNDRFVQTHFDYKTVDEWKNAIRKDLEEEKITLAWDGFIDYIVESSDFELDEGILYDRAAELALQTEGRAIAENMTMDEYTMRTMGFSEAQFYHQCYSICKKNIQEYLLVGAIASSSSLNVSNQEFQEYCLENDLDKGNLPEEEKIYVYYYVLKNEIIKMIFDQW